MAPLSRRAAARMAEMAGAPPAPATAAGSTAWTRSTACAASPPASSAPARPHEVAFVENTSTALSMVAEGLDWRSGDNVVGAALEFPSNVYPWMELATSRGVEYHQVPRSATGGSIPRR